NLLTDQKLTAEAITYLFFQAEDGIRDRNVTGVQTCALPISGISKKINLGLDLQGGFEILYEVEPIDEDQQVSKKLLESTVQTLNDRVNRLGISETVIDIEGDDRIRVQLAGVKDQEEARDMLSTSALLTFSDVDDNVK